MFCVSLIIKEELKLTKNKMPKEGFREFGRNEAVNRKFTEKISKEEGSLQERAEGIMWKVEEEARGHEEAEKYLPVAGELLDEYGSSSNIPEEKLEAYPGELDDGKLLAYAIYLEKEREKKAKKLH